MLKNAVYIGKYLWVDDLIIDFNRAIYAIVYTYKERAVG